MSNEQQDHLHESMSLASAAASASSFQLFQVEDSILLSTEWLSFANHTGDAESELTDLEKVREAEASLNTWQFGRMEIPASRQSLVSQRKSDSDSAKWSPTLESSAQTGTHWSRATGSHSNADRVVRPG